WRLRCRGLRGILALGGAGGLLAVPLRVGCRPRFLDKAEDAPELRLDLPRQVGVLLQELADVLASLAQPSLAIGEPGAALVDDLVRDGEIDEIADARDAGAVQDVELGDLEGRSGLVLD